MLERHFYCCGSAVGRKQPTAPSLSYYQYFVFLCVITERFNDIICYMVNELKKTAGAGGNGKCLACFNLHEKNNNPEFKVHVWVWVLIMTAFK